MLTNKKKVIIEIFIFSIFILMMRNKKMIKKPEIHNHRWPEIGQQLYGFFFQFQDIDCFCIVFFYLFACFPSLIFLFLWPLVIFCFLFIFFIHNSQWCWWYNTCFVTFNEWMNENCRCILIFIFGFLVTKLWFMIRYKMTFIKWTNQQQQQQQKI